MSGGKFPGGTCPGGLCPRTRLNMSCPCYLGYLSKG